MTDSVGLSVTVVDRVISVVGEVDASSVGRLVAALRPVPDGDVIVDLSGVTFLDSSGLRVLVEAHHDAQANGGSLLLRRPASVVRRLLEVSGLLGHLSVVPPTPES